MSIELLSRVTILAVGVERYENIRPLYGPRSDLEKIHQLLVSSSKTALFSEQQFIQLYNPSSNDLRSCINAYTLGRSAVGDILVLYFSGHGIPIGNSDFGFCTIDTMVHPGSNVVLPFTVVRLSELLESLSVMSVIPVIIIDACYSGLAGNAVISPHDAISHIHQGIRKSAASNYALLCSCSEYQVSLDSSHGGIFSQLLFDVLSDDMSFAKKRSHLISLKEIYQPLLEAMERQSYDATPRFYIGDTLPNFPLVKNIRFSPQSYSFVGHLHCVIQALWNNGNDRELSLSQIQDMCGMGAYGNHQKLSLEPWGLVENAPNSKRKRRLTHNGKLFAKGKLKIPKTIEKDPSTGKWIASPGTPEINVFDLVDVLGAETVQERRAGPTSRAKRSSSS